MGLGVGLQTLQEGAWGVSWLAEGVRGYKAYLQVQQAGNEATGLDHMTAEAQEDYSVKGFGACCQSTAAQCAALLCCQRA